MDCGLTDAGKDTACVDSITVWIEFWTPGGWSCRPRPCPAWSWAPSPCRRPSCRPCVPARPRRWSRFRPCRLPVIIINKSFTLSNSRLSDIKVWWPYATLFAFIYLYTIDTFIHHSFITIRWGPLSAQCQWVEPPWGAVRSQDSNSGLPYSKPERSSWATLHPL